MPFGAIAFLVRKGPLGTKALKHTESAISAVLCFAACLDEQGCWHLATSWPIRSGGIAIHQAIVVIAPAFSATQPALPKGPFLKSLVLSKDSFEAILNFPWSFLTKEIPWCFEGFSLLFCFSRSFVGFGGGKKSLVFWVVFLAF